MSDLLSQEFLTALISGGLVAPSASRMIAIPITIWSSRMRTENSTINSEATAPATIPAASPSHSEPVL